MKKPGTSLSRFNPDAYWYNAREEVLFGSGTFTLGCSSPEEARLIERRWANAMLKHEQGLMFNIKREVDGCRIHITLSAIGEQALRNTGYSKEQVEVFSMNPHWKKGFILDFLRHLKDLSL